MAFELGRKDLQDIGTHSDSIRTDYMHGGSLVPRPPHSFCRLEYESLGMRLAWGWIKYITCILNQFVT